jgi:hypothetical protein
VPGPDESLLDYIRCIMVGTYYLQDEVINAVVIAPIELLERTYAAGPGLDNKLLFPDIWFSHLYLALYLRLGFSDMHSIYFGSKVEYHDSNTFITNPLP